MNLPFAGGVVGVGDPGQPPPYNVDKAKVNSRLRFYSQDTWKDQAALHVELRPGVEFREHASQPRSRQAGVPAPLYGSDLSPTENNYNNFSPAVGFAWSLDKASKTVLRGGAGLYWETELLWRRLQERAAIGPIGNGRLQIPHTAFTNIFPGIVNLNTGLPVAVGQALPASGQVTNMTVAQFMQIYNAQIAAVQAQLAPKNPNDLSVRNIQFEQDRRRSLPARISGAAQHSHEPRHPARAAGQHAPRGGLRPAKLRKHAVRITGPEPLQPFHQRRADASHPAMPDRRAAERSERPVLRLARLRSGRRRPRDLQRRARQAR